MAIAKLFPRRVSFLCLLWAAVPSLWAATSFNGNWDITVPNEERGRAWWLKIEGAGTGKPKGDFVSAFDGNLNPIEELSIKGNKLVFGFHPKSRFPGREKDTRHLVYSAELVGEKLEGTFVVEGQKAPPLHWTAVRAPVIQDADDGTWREGKSITLFDGRSLTGWHLQESTRGGWVVKDGVLTGTGKASNLVSDRKFWNFNLHVEFLVPPESNSGVGLRARYEVQIKDDYGQTPDTHSSAALYSRIAATKNASKPTGSWQSYDIRLVGRQVTIRMNGETVIEKGTIEGLTAMATDPDEAKPGAITLQGDHGPVRFRKITITPLEKK